MKWLKKLTKYGLILGMAGALIGAIAGYAIYLHLEPRLPAIDNLRDVQLQVPLRVYTADDKLIAEFGEKRRIPLAYDELPDAMVNAFVAAEDSNFFSHPGVDYRGLLRAGVKLALTGERRQGGSTITMQVARNFYLSREKTFLRKINEILLALKIEKELSKQEILALYLNKIYLGHRAYGVGAAAQVYYDKPVNELTLAETAMIAGLPKAPSRYNPIANPSRAIQRRDYVLGRMLELGMITRQDYERAIHAPVTAKLHKASTEVAAPYLAEMVRAHMTEHYGDTAYTAGYTVYTTLDANKQGAAKEALRSALDAYDQRHGYRGAERHLDPLPDDPHAFLNKQAVFGHLQPALVIQVDEKTAVVQLPDDRTLVLQWDGLEWARPYLSEDRRGPEPKTAADILRVGDLIRVSRYQREDGTEAWRLAQTPAVAGALVSLDPSDGAILALTGGYDYRLSKFNRVTQARRQPGSGFKAFIYSAALEAGFTPASLINDAPVVFDDPSLEATWRPENYSGKFFGPTRLRYALTKSRNLVSIRLLRAMGIKRALKHIARFGFDTNQLPHDLSLALGSGTVTPLEMARGYAVLANGGFLIDPYFIRQIQLDGVPVFEASPAIACDDCSQAGDSAQQPTTETPAEDTTEPPPEIRQAPRVISPQNRYLMYSMMQDVITRGTATRARVLGRKDLAGKTGTTNDQRDAWFNGYNQSIVGITWVGFDNNSKLGRGEVGGRAALPAWIDYMKVALKGIPDVPPEMPDGMVIVRIDPETGLRAPAGMPGAIFEVFREENVPELAETPSPDSKGAATPSGTPSAVEQELF